MDLNQDASRNEDEMSVFTEESKKKNIYNFGGKCNNFLMRWVKDKK